jgi:hypothetical protein
VSTAKRYGPNEVAGRGYKCPVRESSAYLCDKVAEYHIQGTDYCESHARRKMEGTLHEVAPRAAQEAGRGLEGGFATWNGRF